MQDDHSRNCKDCNLLEANNSLILKVILGEFRSHNLIHPPEILAKEEFIWGSKPSLFRLLNASWAKPPVCNLTFEQDRIQKGNENGSLLDRKRHASNVLEIVSIKASEFSLMVTASF